MEFHAYFCQYFEQKLQLAQFKPANGKTFFLPSYEVVQDAAI